MDAWEEFYKKYLQPRVEKIIVGFSGIDPDEYSFSLTDEQLELVKDLVLAYLLKLTIKIDSGNIDPDEPEPEVQPVMLKPSEIPHELLDGLLGGGEEGHYHLTSEELEKLQAYPAIRDINGNIDHEKLSGLLGGAANKHYHLTQEEREKLGKLIAAFIPTGQTDVKIPTDNHEDLEGLLGGANNEHYHFTLTEYNKLKKILDLLYPDGASEPKLPPSSPSGGDDEPSGGEDDTPSGTIFDGLPSVDPPGWESKNFPNYNSSKKCSAYSAVHTMHYGLSYAKYNETRKTGLHVLMEYGNSTNVAIMFTTNLSDWTKKDEISKSNFVSQGISQYLAWDTGLTTNTYRYRLYIMLPGKKSSFTQIRYLYASSGQFYSTDQAAKSTTPYVACCRNDSRAIFISSDGNVARLEKATPLKGETIKVGMKVNAGCAAWSSYVNLFCVSGPNGTATSGDGKSWTVHTTAPKNLVDLVYREDIPGSQPKGFFARSTEDKCFYASADGKTWLKVNTAPIPLDDVAAVAYAPELGWYCAIGGTSKYAWFSKNLTAWRSTKVSNSDVEMGSVIWMPNIQRFVLMPKSGEIYYTFNPADWK